MAGFDWIEEKAAEAKSRIAEKQTETPPVEEDSHTLRSTTLGFYGQVNISKELVKAAHGLKIAEKKLIMFAVSKIHPKATQPKHPKPDNAPNTYIPQPYLCIRVDAVEYAKEMKVKALNNAYRDLRVAAKNLFKRYITLEYTTPKGVVSEDIHWVSRAKYHKGEGWVELVFTPDVSPHLSELPKGNQVIYKLEKAVELKSVYSWRLLELLLQWQDKKRLYIRVEDFRKALEVPKTYKFAQMRVNCIERAIKDLEENAGLIVTYETHKNPENKKQIGSFRFKWCWKNETPDNTEEQEEIEFD